MNLQPPKAANKGFALIVTLSLMILLTVIAVGLLTLSSISLRSSSQSADMAAARSNARMALLIAVGELQKSAGPDTRVTAPADMVKDGNPPVLGVWKSWEGDDHEKTGSAQGRPISPGNDYKSKKAGRFLSWLVSGVDPATPTVLPDTNKGSNKAILLGDLSVGSGAPREKLQVHLTPTKVNLGTQLGGFAWWVSGENQKARLPNPYKPATDNAGRWAINAKSQSTADPKPFRMDSLLTDATPAAKAITLKQSDLFSAAATLRTSQEFFHDLSTSSVGLLTNVATGGWKKDLSLFTEGMLPVAGGAANPGTGNLPLFRLKPGQDITSNIPTSGDPTPAKSMLYPWAAYRGSASDMAIYRHGPVTSWENFTDYALSYRRISVSGTTGKCTLATSSFPIDGDAFSFLHKVRILPVIARLQWVFSYTAGPPTPVTGQPVPPAGTLEPRLLVTPVITMWNPYNVELNIGALGFYIGKPLPAAFKFTVNGAPNTKFNRLFMDNDSGGNTNNLPALSSVTTMNYQISNFGPALKPGETRVFSPGPSVGQVPAGNTLELQAGYRSKGGNYFVIKNDSGVNLTAPGTATIKADAKFDTSYNDASPGVGIYLDMSVGIGGPRHLAYRMVYTPAVAKAVYKDLKGSTSDPLSKIAGSPFPFMTTVFGARMASKTHIAAKGFVQSSPLVNYTAMGGKDLIEATIKRHYAGTNHPVNSPFDYSSEAVAGAGDSLLPNESDTTNRGYIVTGFIKGDGLSRCVIDELPTRPLQSLAELQNWDMRYENPVPPFAFNLIGNSDATPIVAPSSVVGPLFSDTLNLQHDDSYCANHLLFDDWFFSSIAPDPTTFGVSGKTLKTAYIDFVTGVSPLGNRAYKALTQDTNLAAISIANTNTLYNTHVYKADSWKKIASRLEVEGMFNVNSTSVTAWRALLGHARNQKVPYIKDAGSAWSVDLSGESDYAFSRFAVAGDSDAKSQGTSGAFVGAAEFAGYRLLDDKILDALAEEIVTQVRLRGPFLSLSEFINRQLSTDKTLAIAGAVQTALDQIAKNSGTNPYKGITDVISRSASAVPASAGDAEYKFPEAAVGQATYGLPGWTRQADVLRALAPILTARDDTFTIRAYGDVRDGKGNVKARATCEAVVRRTREYVDPGDLAEITTLPTKAANITFGRRFQIISYRWLSPSEI
ncbi:MAG: hypothetical protein V4819_14535 [Verrucomicrobiota bacterium]